MWKRVYGCLCIIEILPHTWCSRTVISVDPCLLYAAVNFDQKDDNVITPDNCACDYSVQVHSACRQLHTAHSILSCHTPHKWYIFIDFSENITKDTDCAFIDTIILTLVVAEKSKLKWSIWVSVQTCNFRKAT